MSSSCLQLTGPPQALAQQPGLGVPSGSHLGQQAVVGFLRRLEARRGVQLQQPLEHSLQVRGYRRLHGADGRRGVGENAGDGGGGVLGGVGVLPAQQLVQDDARRIEVAAGVDPGAASLLRAHVAGCPDEHAGAGQVRAALGGAGDAEVRHLEHSGRGQQQVLGLEVAVDDAPGVSVDQARQQLQHHLLRQRRGEGAHLLQQSAHRAAIDELGGHEVVPIGLAGVVDLHDVGVAQRAGRAGLVEEAGDEGRVVLERRAHDLERDQPTAAVFPGQVHRGHATPTEHPVHRVATHPAFLELLIGRHERRVRTGNHRRVGPEALPRGICWLIRVHQAPLWGGPGAPHTYLTPPPQPGIGV